MNLVQTSSKMLTNEDTVSGMPTVLCITEFYKPGFKGGGPTRSVSGLVSHLNHKFQFKVWTRDRDLGDTVPYSGINIDSWQHGTGCDVFYASPAAFSLTNIPRMLRHTEYDILYLNSFFNFKASILPNLIHHNWLRRNVPVIIAPRGEFSPGSLSQKKHKKSFFLRTMRNLLPYSSCYWQATSDIERGYISNTLGVPRDRIFVASNIPDITINRDFTGKNDTSRDMSILRIIFLSRISPEKNLLFLLESLRKSACKIELNIFGPIQDHAYWNRCQAAIAQLPSNVNANYRGQVEHSNVRATFRENDLFVFPSCGENFGHVIFESLSSGTCVITSDQTPWKTDGTGAITVLSLRDVAVWSQAINDWASQAMTARVTFRDHAFQFAQNYLSLSQGISEHLEMFQSVMRTNTRTRGNRKS